MCEKLAALGYGVRVTLHLHCDEDIDLRITSVDCECGYMTGTTRNGRHIKVFMHEISYFDLL